MRYIKYFLLHTTLYQSWLSANGFLLSVLDTFTEDKVWCLASILLKISWKEPQCIFSVQTYLFKIHIKWAKYENLRMYFYFEFLRWEKDFLWYREEPKE